MKYFVKYLICFLFLTSLLEAEVRKNLEIKLQLDGEKFQDLQTQLIPYYRETLLQTDTYFKTKQGRLKLRVEEGKKTYLIRYERPDLEEAKQSNYQFYPVDDAPLFLSVLGDSIAEEIQVKKSRALYFPKPHIRVHLDQVEKLGNFLEVEIILSNEVALEVAEKEMRELQEWLQLASCKKITQSYRELLQQTLSSAHKDFNYYKQQNKVFWVLADDLLHFKRYDVIPCIFVEQFEDGRYGIIQLDPTIAADHFQYTAWRKLIGQEHNFRAEVLLIDLASDKLYNLKGAEVAFDSLTRSSRIIDKSYLAPFGTIRNSIPLPLQSENRLNSENFEEESSSFSLVDSNNQRRDL